jgi:hypothetical protein
VIKKIIITIICLLLLNLSLKKLMQNRIANNYRMRECGFLPDEWYWVDKIYLKLYGDYDFYE